MKKLFFGFLLLSTFIIVMPQGPSYGEIRSNNEALDYNNLEQEMNNAIYKDDYQKVLKILEFRKDFLNQYFYKGIFRPEKQLLNEHDTKQSFLLSAVQFKKDTENNLNILKALINIGADIHKFEFGCSNALIEVCKNGKIKVANFLISQGSYINARDFYGKSALDYAKMGKFKELEEMLVKHGANDHSSCCVIL